MAIRFLNKTNANNVSVIQNSVNIGSNDDPDVLLHLRSNSRTGDIPTIRIQDYAGAEGVQLDIKQEQRATKLTGVDSFEFNFYTVYTDTVLKISKRAKSTGAFEGAVGVLRSFPTAALDVGGGVRIADDQDVAVASKAGTMRYREIEARGEITRSRLEMCMRIGNQPGNVSQGVYQWVIIQENVW